MPSTLTLYMRSGNRIRIPFVKDWTVKTRNGSVTSLSVEWHWLRRIFGGEKLILPSVDLSQVEAITRS